MDQLGIPAIDIELERLDETGLSQHRAALAAVVAAVADQPASPVVATEGAADARLYVVQAGDTLANIAWRLGINVDALAVANGIMDPELIAVGDTLIIPN